MLKTIVIIGVTGTQGHSVANTFLELLEWKVRGVTRNPASEKAQALAARGVEIVKADLDDKESLLPTFEGATAIFANTDFFIHLQEALKTGTSSTGRNPKQQAYDREVAQGINIAEAAASPSVLKTLERFVLSSLSDATKWSKGKFTEVYHFDSKAEMIRVIHTRFPELATRMSTLQIGHYVTMWKVFPPLAPQKQADGSFLISRPIGPEVPMPLIYTQKDTGSFVKGLVESPPGKDLLGVSEYMTWPDWVALLGKTLGVKVAYKQVSHDEFFHGVPEPMKEELSDAFDYISEFGYDGGDPDVVAPKDLGVEVVVTPMEEYIKGEDWSSVLSS